MKKLLQMIQDSLENKKIKKAFKKRESAASLISSARSKLRSSNDALNIVDMELEQKELKLEKTRDTIASDKASNDKILYVLNKAKV